MNEPVSHKEFRYYYFTNKYQETVLFYRDQLGLEEMSSWDRDRLDRGTIFWCPNRVGLIEIEEAEDTSILQGGLYIEVADVEDWYKKLIQRCVPVTRPLADTSYGHRSFTVQDPNKLRIGFFSYLTQ